MSLETVLITGASSGIGKNFAQIFAKNKYNLILIARREDRLKKIKNDLEEKYGIKVTILTKDLANVNAAQEIFEFTQQNNLKVDILVNNAGFGLHGNFIDIPLEKELNMIQVNITSLVSLTKVFLPQMIEKKSGKILNVASTAAFLPGPGMNVYFATKAFVLNFSQALDVELKPFNVSVTALCPGPTQSEFSKDMQKVDVFQKNSQLPTSQKVAEFGYNKLMQKKSIAIHGFNNFFSVQLARLLPKSWQAKIVQQIFS